MRGGACGCVTDPTMKKSAQLRIGARSRTVTAEHEYRIASHRDEGAPSAVWRGDRPVAYGTHGRDRVRRRAPNDRARFQRPATGGADGKRERTSGAAGQSDP